MGLSFREIAKHLNVAVSTVCSVMKRFQDTGEVKHCQQPRREELRKLDTH